MANNNAQFKRDINFFSVLQEYESEQKKSEKNSGFVPGLVIAAVAVLAVLYVGGLVWQTAHLNTQIRALQAYVTDTENMAVYQTRSGIKDELSALIAYNENCAVYIQQLQKASRIARENFESVRNMMPASTQVLDFSYTEPVLTVRCQTSDKNAPAAYARKLSESGQFVDVTYTGFGSTGTGETAESFVFKIQCRLW